MPHQIIEVETSTGLQQHVVIDRGDGSFESFPVDPENPRYQQFLEQTTPKTTKRRSTKKGT